MNKTDLQQLAEERLADAQVLPANGRSSAAYYVEGSDLALPGIR